jgi:chitinase
MTLPTLPLKVIYIDQISTWYPDPTVDFRQAADAGYNVIILAFYLSSGPADAVYAWTNTATDDQRNATLNYIHSKGAILMMSAGGATESPYNNISGQDYGTQTGEFAVKYLFDGVDYDLENFGPGLTYGNLSSQDIINWLSDCTSACKSILGSHKFISHAPQAPYIGPIGSSNTWAGPLGGYASVNDKVGSMIDFYNIQFYNQGESCYTTYNSLFVNSCPSFPETSISQIFNSGFPLNKLIVGKPMLPSDASNGYIDPTILGQWFDNANKSLGWNAGVMTWQWHGLATSQLWLNKVYPIQSDNTVINDTITEIYGYKCKSTKSKSRICIM